MANARKTSRTVGRKTRSTKWDRDAANLLEALAAKLRGERIAGRSESCVTPSSPGNASVSCGAWTLAGKKCKANVRTSDIIYHDADSDVACFCKRHEEGLLTYASGFYSKKKGRDQWVEFDDYIMDDLQPQTKAALRSPMVKPRSPSDEPGYIYALKIRAREDADTPNMFRVKIGRTKNLNKRVRQWERKSKKVVLKGWWPEAEEGGDRCELIELNDPGEKGAWCHRLERLIHIELADRALYQPHYKTDMESDEERSERVHLREPLGESGTVHKEIFSFMRPEGGKYVRKEWRKLVRPVIKRWREFVEKYV